MFGLQEGAVGQVRAPEQAQPSGAPLSFVPGGNLAVASPAHVPVPSVGEEEELFGDGSLESAASVIRGKRVADIASIPVREGVLRGNAIARRQVESGVRTDAPTTVVQVDMASLEVLMRKVVRDEVSELKDVVSGLRQDLVDERTARVSDVSRLDARLDAFDVKLSAGGGSGHGLGGEGVSEEEQLLSVIGGYGVEQKEMIEQKVAALLANIDGFVEVFGKGDVPKIVYARFSSIVCRDSFVRQQKRLDGFVQAGLWADKTKPYIIRKVNRVLGKIKRGICEVAKVDGKQIILDRPGRVVYRVAGQRLQEVARVNLNGDIMWNATVEGGIRTHVASLVAAVS